MEKMFQALVAFYMGVHTYNYIYTYNIMTFNTNSPLAIFIGYMCGSNLIITRYLLLVVIFLQ